MKTIQLDQLKGLAPDAPRVPLDTAMLRGAMDALFVETGLRATSIYIAWDVWRVTMVRFEVVARVSTEAQAPKPYHVFDGVPAYETPDGEPGTATINAEKDGELVGQVLLTNLAGVQPPPYTVDESPAFWWERPVGVEQDGTTVRRVLGQAPTVGEPWMDGAWVVDQVHRSGMFGTATEYLVLLRKRGAKPRRMPWVWRGHDLTDCYEVGSGAFKPIEGVFSINDSRQAMLLNDLASGTGGDLTHPVLGHMRARIKEASVAGERITVKWTLCDDEAAERRQEGPEATVLRARLGQALGVAANASDDVLVAKAHEVAATAAEAGAHEAEADRLTNAYGQGQESGATDERRRIHAALVAKWSGTDYANATISLADALAVVDVSSCARTVYDDIRAERVRQDAKWGGPGHDDEHDRLDWVTFLLEHTAKAVGGSLRAERLDGDGKAPRALHDRPWRFEVHVPNVFGRHGDPGRFRRQTVRVAALAVAAVEAHDRFFGKAKATEAAPCPLGDACPDARGYGAVHPAPPRGGLWRWRADIPGGGCKYLVQRRDGSVPDWPYFVIGARDPTAPAGLRALAAAAKEQGLDPRYVADLGDLAKYFEKYRAVHGAGDPDAGPYRKDDPAIIAKMTGADRGREATVDMLERRLVRLREQMASKLTVELVEGPEGDARLLLALDGLRADLTTATDNATRLGQALLEHEQTIRAYQLAGAKYGDEADLMAPIKVEAVLDRLAGEVVDWRIRHDGAMSMLTTLREGLGEVFTVEATDDGMIGIVRRTKEDCWQAEEALRTYRGRLVDLLNMGKPPAGVDVGAWALAQVVVLRERCAMLSKDFGFGRDALDVLTGGPLVRAMKQRVVWLFEDQSNLMDGDPEQEKYGDGAIPKLLAEGWEIEIASGTNGGTHLILTKPEAGVPRP